MSVRILILMVLAAVLVLRLIQKDYAKGLALSVALIVALPDYLRLSLPGGLPEFTVQRLLLLVLLLFWMRQPRRAPLSVSAPFFPWLCLFGAAQLISLLLSIHPTGSFKYLLSYALEAMLFYVILSTSLADRRSILLLLQYLMVGLGCVAIIGVLEKYREVNLSQWLVLGTEDMDYQNVTSTYPHRILFGYAMAMVVPVLIVLLGEQGERKRRRQIWLWLLLVVGGCYFSNSRGPWIGLIAGTFIAFLLGSSEARRKLLLVGAFAVLIMIARPGVRETVWDSMHSLFEGDDTLKGSSASYRTRLWYVAYAEITKGIERTAFGYGGLSTETMDLSHYFTEQGAGSAGFLGYTSWDNHYASDLIEFGFVGFVTEVFLLLAIMSKLVRGLNRSRGVNHYLIGAMVAGCVVFLWAMSNVWIFSPQLKALFWSLVATGTNLARVNFDERSADPKVQRAEGFASSRVDSGNAPDRIPAFRQATTQHQ